MQRGEIPQGGVLPDAEPAPLHQQIRRSIRDGIVAGAHLAGERLPSETQLAQGFRTTFRGDVRTGHVLGLALRL